MKWLTPPVCACEPAPVTTSLPLPVVPMLMPSFGPLLPVPSICSLPPLDTVTRPLAPTPLPMVSSAALLLSVLRPTIHCDPAPLTVTVPLAFSVPRPFGEALLLATTVFCVRSVPPASTSTKALVVPPGVPKSAELPPATVNTEVCPTVSPSRRTSEPLPCTCNVPVEPALLPTMLQQPPPQPEVSTDASSSAPLDTVSSPVPQLPTSRRTPVPTSSTSAEVLLS